MRAHPDIVVLAFSLAIGACLAGAVVGGWYLQRGVRALFRHWDRSPRPCPRCKGEGVLLTWGPRYGAIALVEGCPDCDGTGEAG